MSSLQKVYDAFFVKMLDDEWAGWEDSEVSQDLRALLDGAIPWFKFPRKSLEIKDNDFVEVLDNEEIQILANYMKCEWLNRSILTWERIKPLYEEKDFSEANMLDKLNQTLDVEKKKAAKLEAIYYRSIKRRPFDYSQLAGDQNG